MGDNEIKVIEEYLEQLEIIRTSKKNFEIERAEARLHGIVFTYQAYTGNTIDELREKYNRIS